MHICVGVLLRKFKGVAEPAWGARERVMVCEHQSLETSMHRWKHCIIEEASKPVSGREEEYCRTTESFVQRAMGETKNLHESH